MNIYDLPLSSGKYGCHEPDHPIVSVIAKRFCEEIGCVVEMNVEDIIHVLQGGSPGERVLVKRVFVDGEHFGYTYAPEIEFQTEEEEVEWFEIEAKRLATTYKNFIETKKVDV